MIQRIWRTTSMAAIGISGAVSMSANRAARLICARVGL
jgi:hypothetical protein